MLELRYRMTITQCQNGYLVEIGTQEDLSQSTNQVKHLIATNYDQAQAIAIEALSEYLHNKNGDAKC